MTPLSAYSQVFVRKVFSKCIISVMVRKNMYGRYTVTPVGYFTGAMENCSCGVSHWDYFALVKMRYLGATGMIFPRLALL
jgi:hypothetical protein